LVSNIVLGREQTDIESGANLILNKHYVGWFGREYKSLIDFKCELIFVTEKIIKV